ncbi:hypothetical protein BCT69_16530 [Enterovibrio norvegicus]|nr:hypothetical protein BCT69_16530 [Enterovibrio norvegicus]
MATEQYEKHIVMKPPIHLYHAPLSLKALTHATDKVMVFLECLSRLSPNLMVSIVGGWATGFGVTRTDRWWPKGVSYVRTAQVK